jgi:putative ABC transport system substrate-binding protein
MNVWCAICLPYILGSFEVNAGALMSYGPTSLENHAGAARYVDRILKGTKISELPFKEPTEFKLAINLRTARSIKVKIPPPCSPAPTR